MAIKTYNPQISVVVYKSYPREEIVPGLKADATRLNRGDGIELMPFLGDGGSVSTNKNIRQPMGSFVIRLGAQKDGTLMDDIAALCEPGDLCEIRMSHEAVEKNKQLPLIMRGFIAEIARHENVDQNGRPQRFVELHGNDLSRVLSSIIINYKFGSLSSMYSVDEFRFMRQFVGSEGIKTLSGNEFCKVLIDKVINPHLQLMKGLAKLDGKDTQASSAIQDWQIEASIDGTISSVALNSANDISIYDLCRMLLDIESGFNELFVEDRDNEPPVLVLRPTPFRDVATNDYIQSGAWADQIYISSQDILSMSTRRSDQGVANFFWCQSPKMADLGVDFYALAAQGGPETYTSYDYHNSRLEIHGFREMNVEVSMGSNEAKQSDAPHEVEHNGEIATEKNFLIQRRKDLIKINRDNILFESCQFNAKGNPDIRPGMFVGICRGIKQDLSGVGYCFEVNHSFIPLQGFTTSCSMDRYTNYIERSKSPVSLYLSDIESGITSDINPTWQDEFANSAVRIR